MNLTDQTDNTAPAVRLREIAPPSSYTLKLDPHPHVLFTVGLSNLKPAASSVST